jgi:hypothetical protein
MQQRRYRTGLLDGGKESFRGMSLVWSSVPTVLLVVLVYCGSVFTGCGSDGAPDPLNRPAWARAASDSLAESPNRANESAIQRLALQGPMSGRDAQISGLAWWGDNLVLLPQYPSFATPDTAHLYAISRLDLDAALQPGGGSMSVTPTPIPIDTSGLQGIAGYQGIESIAFADDHAFLTIEAAGIAFGMVGMRASIASGRLHADGAVGSPFALSVNRSASLSVPSWIPNMAYEAVVIQEGQPVALFEANGANVTPDATAMRFASTLDPVASLPTPALEYRLTDATAADSSGRFWVTNYLYPGEARRLNPAPDSVALMHGIGESHRRRVVVERLVEFAIRDDRIVRTSTPPVWIELAEGTGRNWEGVVRYRDGFLIATDTFPETILAFVHGPLSRPPQ